MSSPSEKVRDNLAEAVVTLGQLVEEFDREKEELEAEKDLEIEAIRGKLEAEKAMHRATRLAGAGSSNMSKDGCHMIVAVDLKIVWSDTPEYWTWTAVPESRDAVAELLSVCWLEISCRLDMDKLSRHTNYASYLVYKLAEDNYGLDLSPAEAYAGNAEEENMITKIYLVTEEDQAGSERADKYPDRRPDGWMEVELGEYFIDELETFGEIEMGIKEVTGNWKKGLIVRGIEVRSEKK